MVDNMKYFLILLFATTLYAAPKRAQTQPTPQRVAEIQTALKSHGFEPGTTWKETQESCRKVADAHLWQTDYAPDARVLILIGLGGPNSDSSVIGYSTSNDADQRAEALRRISAKNR
jgi:hypothetical protein